MNINGSFLSSIWLILTRWTVKCVHAWLHYTSSTPHDLFNWLIMNTLRSFPLKPFFTPRVVHLWFGKFKAVSLVGDISNSLPVTFRRVTLNVLWIMFVMKKGWREMGYSGVKNPGGNIIFFLCAFFLCEKFTCLHKHSLELIWLHSICERPKHVGSLRFSTGGEAWQRQAWEPCQPFWDASPHSNKKMYTQQQQ